MKKVVLLIIFLTSIASINFALEKDTAIKNQTSHFPYVGIDTYGILPTIGVGYRYKKGFNGIDLFASVGIGAHARAIYLFYPNTEGVYLGIGGGAVYLPDYGITNSITPSFEGSIGYQWQNHIFFQLNAIAPFKITSKGFESKIIPGITLGYGF